MNFREIINYLICKIQYKFLYTRRNSITVLNDEATLDAIINHHVSVSRFGDGELNMVFSFINGFDESRKSGFQTFNIEMGQRLTNILKGIDSTADHVVCLPGCMFGIGTDYLRRYAASFWEQYTVKYLDQTLSILDKERTYGETNFSRFYLSHRDKSHCGEYLQKVKQIWEGRDILIVEGSKTLLGVGNNLFDNAASIRRILCPPRNAWNRYQEILKTVTETASADSTNKPLILCALGMTATILAFDLAKAGYQAIDIGHIDIEYEWMLMGATSKVPVPGKFTNEAHAEISKTFEDDNVYQSQIIARID